MDEKLSDIHPRRSFPSKHPSDFPPRLYPAFYPATPARSFPRLYPSLPLVGTYKPPVAFASPPPFLQASYPPYGGGLEGAVTGGPERGTRGSYTCHYCGKVSRDHWPHKPPFM